MFWSTPLNDTHTHARLKHENRRERRARTRVVDFRLMLIVALLALTGPLAAGVRAHVLDEGFNPGDGPGSAVTAVDVQADGKVYIGGAFDYQGSHIGIARLNPDGSFDPTFDASADGSVFAIKVQADGRILVGGGFQHMNGRLTPGLARFQADGTFDPFFNPRLDGTVLSIAQLPDGKILVGGFFSNAGGRPVAKVARLNRDGSLDTSFNPGSGPDHFVFAVAPQPDGKVLIGGMFTGVNGYPRNYIARLNVDGSLDTSFDLGANGYVRALAVQPDGRIVVGGDFTQIAGSLRNGIAKLLPDGGVDGEFDVREGANGSVRAVGLLSNGGVLIGGEFTQVSGQPRANLAALHPNGSLAYMPWAAGPVNAISVNKFDKAVVGGDFREIEWEQRNFVARFVPPVSVDDHFNPKLKGWADIVVLQPDGKLVVGGSFSQISGVTRNNIGRLNADGTLDASFDPGAGADARVMAVTVQPDGRILIGGLFKNVDGRPRAGLARLYPDGRLDEAFDPSPWETQYSPAIYAIAAQPNGGIIVSGSFSRIAGGDRNGLARLNADGTLDTSFNTNPSRYPEAIVLQPDGRILIAGEFNSVDGQRAESVARLNRDGTLDTSFHAEVDIDQDMSLIGLLPDGKMIVAGRSYPSGTKPIANIARLNPDGSLDSSFEPPPPPPAEYRYYVDAMAVQTDGSVILATSYSLFMGGSVRTIITRLNRSGGIEEGFAPEVNSFVQTILPLPDGKVLFGGGFSSINGEAYSDLALLHNTGVSKPKLSFSFYPDSVVWSRGLTTSEVERVSFEISSDGVNYRHIGDGTRVDAGWSLGGLSLPVGQRFFIRARGFVGPSGSGSIFETSREFCCKPPDIWGAN